MLIPAVEDGLESYLRASLPLPRDVGDISFERPSGTWATQVTRITVNLFLYGISRSPVPPRPAASRRSDGGEGGGPMLERRPALPMVQLSFLVSAWSGRTRDEHQLLGDVLTRLITQQVLPAEHVAAPLNSNVTLTLAADDQNRPRELWSGLGGQHKAAFTLLATVASDAYAWAPAAAPVRGVEGSATRLEERDERDERTAPDGEPPRPALVARRAPGGGLHADVTEPAPRAGR
ncbi:MAG: DUF4255 domain-containing protein [Kineosporiaceae bacterium]